MSESFLKKLKTVQIKNKESLVNIKKPLDDLLSSLKYIPLEAVIFVYRDDHGNLPYFSLKTFSSCCSYYISPSDQSS